MHAFGIKTAEGHRCLTESMFYRTVARLWMGDDQSPTYGTGVLRCSVRHFAMQMMMSGVAVTAN